jgi:hypothetical protein
MSNHENEETPINLFNAIMLTILIGIELTIWRFQIMDKILELKSDELLDDTVFRKKYLAAFNKSICFTKMDWHSFINAISEKAEIYDVADFPINIEKALYICSRLLELKVDSIPEHLYFMFDKKNGTYIVPFDTVKSVVKDLHLNIGIKVLRLTLEKLNVKKLDECVVEIYNQKVNAWILDAAKLELEVSGWD